MDSGCEKQGSPVCEAFPFAASLIARDSEKQATAAPRVSVLIPVYNREAVVAQTIESVLAQTFTDFELILCDDCSTDRSVEIIESFTDPRIKLLRNERNMGSSATRNRLDDEARGEYCALQDSDDIALDYRLQVQVEFLDSHRQVDACAGALAIIDVEGRETGRVWYREPYDHETLKVRTLFCCTVAQTALMFRRREFMDSALRYIPGIADDVGLFKTALHKLRFENLGIPLVKYRVWPSQMSTADKSEQGWDALEHLYYQYDLLGLELTDNDKNVLSVVVTGAAVPPELSDSFADLAARISEANRQKHVFDQQALVSYMMSMYKRTVKLAKKKGLCSYARYLRKYRQFKRMLAEIQ